MHRWGVLGRVRSYCIVISCYGTEVGVLGTLSYTGSMCHVCDGRQTYVDIWIPKLQGLRLRLSLANAWKCFCLETLQHRLV